MAKNDIVLLDGIIDQRRTDLIPSEQVDEVFEYLVIEELLKDKDLSREEIESGWVDGRNDGGIDGFYVFVNGIYLQDVDDFSWPRENASLEIWILTSKHHATFKQATVEALVATVEELLDFSKTPDELSGKYSDEVLEIRSLFQQAYRKLSIGRPRIAANVIYASRGDTAEVGESVAARARQIESIVTKAFSSCVARFRFVGASEIVESYRRFKTFTLSLPFCEHLATGANSYVLLVRLRDYWRFVSDEQGKLRRYLFDSNVRDYMGTAGVNEDIAQSLAREGGPEFWWMNNGVTILATNATIPGKTIELQDIQIVNGLQTTETIFRHFESGSIASAESLLLVKILVSSDAQARDRIIQATNNQTPVEITALHATDKIQRDIEEILERKDWYYERRKNYYRNEGRPPHRLVTPMYLASATMSLILRNPARATRLKSKFMRTQEGYESVFSSRVALETWPVLVEIYKQVEKPLSHIAPKRRGERFITTWRGIVALCVVARRFGRFDYPDSALLKVLASGPFTHDEVSETWGAISAGITDWQDRKQLKGSFATRCCEEVAKTFGLTGTAVLGQRGSAAPPRVPLAPGFIDEVNRLLPEQPWKQGVHSGIATALGRTGADVQAAIHQLIADGRRNLQRDGVVYDRDGKVVARDPERARTPGAPQ